MKVSPELSIIILCYRSGENIIPFAEKIHELTRSLTDSYEIILVGNYIENSNDHTEAIVREIAAKEDNFVAVCKPKKGMMGWDMKEGLKTAKGDYLCVIDGDSQFPIENIEKCFNLIKSSSFGLVKTFRTTRGDGIYRKILSATYNWIFSILFPKVKSKDINSKPKIMTREVYEKMRLDSDDWFIDAEIMLNVERLNVEFYEFPTHFRELKDRSSFVKFSAIFEFLKNLILFKIRR
ncbi:glycosyltransferase family 2 protein [Salinimicrobium sp. TH3]|uniref:glycosyltransferase family 2 protein n=1 Tax=Salinimicrobium sp. TH3 TaxID=2997342 RepID=UPI0022757AED|nr:glycosyltransferase family 2 protein [Salinimicrobium sp. TH3]MCY2686938.1 glycosyltransferase family 2 protein [Salinimicrobium sp. TH3]